jgi:hypothetical protein
MKKAGEEVSRTVVTASAPPNFKAESFENDWEVQDGVHANDTIFIAFSRPVDVAVEGEVKKLFPGCKAYTVGKNKGMTTGLTVFLPKNGDEFPKRMQVFFERLAPLFKLEGKIILQISRQTLVWQKAGDRLVLEIKA